MIPEDDDRFVNLDQAIRDTGVSKRSLYNWMTIGRIAYTKRNGTRFVQLRQVRLMVGEMPRAEAARRRQERQHDAERCAAQSHL